MVDLKLGDRQIGGKRFEEASMVQVQQRFAAFGHKLVLVMISGYQQYTLFAVPRHYLSSHKYRLFLGPSD